MQGRRPTWQEQQEIIEDLAARDARNQEQMAKQQKVIVSLAAQNARRQEQDARNQETIKDLMVQNARLQEQIETLLEGQAYRDKKLAYYENPNTPPSADSLEWKMKRRQTAKERESDPDAQGKKPGAKKGHKGKSRNHTPTHREYHKFERKRIRCKDIPILPKCSCGGHTMQGPARTRDIIEMEVRVEETRYCIDTAKCMQCSKIIEAPHDLPRNGSYGKYIVGLVAVLRGFHLG